MSHGEVSRYRGRALYPILDGNTLIEGEVLVYFSDIRLRGFKREELAEVLERVFTKMGV